MELTSAYPHSQTGSLGSGTIHTLTSLNWYVVLTLVTSAAVLQQSLLRPVKCAQTGCYRNRILLLVLSPPASGCCPQRTERCHSACIGDHVTIM